MAAVTIFSDFGAQENKKSVTVSIVFPSICHEVMGPDAMILVLSQLFHSLLSPSSGGSLVPPSLSVIRVVIDISPSSLDSSLSFI